MISLQEWCRIGNNASCCSERRRQVTIATHTEAILKIRDALLSSICEGRDIIAHALTVIFRIFHNIQYKRW